MYPVAVSIIVPGLILAQIMTTIIANGLIVLIVAALTLKFWRANKRVAAGGKVIENQQGFLYTL